MPKGTLDVWKSWRKDREFWWIMGWFFGFWVTHRPCHACAFFVGRGSHRLPPHWLPPLRGCVQRPCHACAGRCGGLGSMAALFLSVCRQGFTPPASTSAAAPSGLCSAAMSCRRWHVRGRASMAAVCWCCFALFPTNNIIPPTEIWRHTYFTVIHYLLYLFVFVLNNRNALYL